MRRVLGLSVALLVPALAAAQGAGQPTVFLAIYAGFASGQSLWRVNQPLCVWVTVTGGYQCEQGPSGFVDDTLPLSRRVTTGLSAGIGLSKYFDTHLGGRVDLWYAEETIQDQCSATVFQPDPDQKNLQTCDSFSSDNASLSLVGVSGSALLRPFPNGGLSPYVRLGAGLVIPTGETLAASGPFAANGELLSRQLIQDSSSQGPRPFGVLAVGLQAGAGVSSRLQLELSDVMLPLARITGPADIAGRAPQSTALTHHFSLTIGFAFVFSGRRGRRY
jgi:hypothetical protein